MRLPVIAIAIATAALASAGCSPITIGAHALLPAQVNDTHEVWIYLQTSDADKSGVYRCYDTTGKPQCIKAQLTDR